MNFHEILWLIEISNFVKYFCHFFKWPHAYQNNLSLILNEDILLQNNSLCDFVENGSCDKNVTYQILQPL